MKITVTAARIFVGLLFIFSGLVKANDPLGLSYKMQEFFEVWKLHGFDGITMALSVTMNAFEIIAGFALLIGWRPKMISWLLLLLIVFFTFLTGYTYYTGLPKNCGCFGDCLPITSGTSFMKDVVLLVLIIFLLWKHKLIKPMFPATAGLIAMILVAFLSCWFQWYTLKHLPVVDCLPFKKGNNILEKRMPPPNAIPDSFAIRFIYKKDGKEFEFSALNLPADLKSYTFVNRFDKLIRKGNATAAITGFDLRGESGTDSTLQILQQPACILLIAENLGKTAISWKTGFADVFTTAKGKNIPVFIITGQTEAAHKSIAGTAFADLPVFTCDNTTIRSAARVSPTMYLLELGTIKGKWGGADIAEATDMLNKVPSISAPVQTHSDSINQ